MNQRVTNNFDLAEDGCGHEENQRDVGEETITMANDLRDYLRQARVDSPDFAEGYVFQVLSRKLNESAIIEYGDDGVPRTAAAVDPDNRDPKSKITEDVLTKLKGGESYVVNAKADKIEAVTALDLDSNIFLYRLSFVCIFLMLLFLSSLCEL